MVWHAYHLNPRDYLEDCVRHGKMNFWRGGYPWEAVNSCIDNSSFEFNPPRQAKTGFEQNTGFGWSSLDDPPEIVVKCPSCLKDGSHPWTNWDRREKWGLETTARGFTDKDYEGTCPHCKSRVRHDTLRLSKFRKDIMALKIQDIPLLGTILNKYGIDLYKYL